MLVFYCEYKKQGRVARKITKIGRNPAKQQLTSLSPPKKTDGTVGFFAVKREITVIVFNI